MQAENGQTRKRAVRPADAASLILVDRAGAAPRFLMGLRHASHKFMPGFMVFPGGRLEAVDRQMSVYGTLPPAAERQLMAQMQRPSPVKARALALCAIRELFEETGILFGEADLGAPEVPGPAWQGFADHGVFPSLEGLCFLARAITPPALPRRFDTRFFLADATGVAATLDGVCGPDSELIELRWLSEAATEKENLAWITRMVLRQAAARLEEGLERDLPVALFREHRNVWRQDEIA